MPKRIGGFILFALLTLAMRGQENTETFSVRRAIDIFRDVQTKATATSPAAPIVDEEYKKRLLKALVAASDHMDRGTGALTGFEKLLVGHVALTNATNPWNDVDFRNWYDEIKDWGTIAGTVAAALAFARDDGEEDGKALKVGGVGLIGVSQLVGRLFGATNSNRIKEKAAFLDITVRAYDDMLAHRRHLENLIESNENGTRGRIARFRATKAALPSEAAFIKLEKDEILVHVTRVQGDLSEYETAIRELLALSENLEALAGGYLLALDQVYSGSTKGVKRQADAVSERLDTVKATSDAREDLRNVITRLREFKLKDAPIVYDFFNLSTEIRSVLKDADVTLRVAQ